MPTVTWDHVHLRSPDPEATAKWLEDILGGEIVRGPGRIDVRLGGANVFIAPVAAGDGVNSPPVTPYQGLDHFGLTVKDIDAVAAEIKAKGVEFTKEPTTIRPGVRICFLRGPQASRWNSWSATTIMREAAPLRHVIRPRHEAANGQSEIALDRPHHGAAGAVGLRDDGVFRHVEPLALDANAVMPFFDSQSTSETALPSASEQHGPFPLFRLSNHCLSGELA